MKEIVRKGLTGIVNPLCVLMTVVILAVASNAFAGTVAKSESLIDQASNNKNPWDKMGRLHNLGLDNIAEALQQVKSPDSLHAHLVIASVAFGNVGNVQLSIDADTADIKQLANIIRSERANYPNLDDEQKVQLEQLVSIATSRHLSPSERIKEIKKFEISLLNQKSVKHAMPLLVAASIGRYSTAYWYSQERETSVWNLHLADIDILLRETDPTVEADIRGAAQIGGDPYTQLAAGLISSGYNIVGRIWDWLF